MLGTLLAFFANANPLLALASNLLPMIAMARSMNDPAVTNAGLLNTMKAIQFVQPIVQQIEAVSTSGPTKMTGADKLALFQATVQEAHDIAVGAGSTSKLVEAMPLLNAAVSVVCAAMKPQAAPTVAGSVTIAPATASNAQQMQNSA